MEVTTEKKNVFDTLRSGIAEFAAMSLALTSLFKRL
jgi:hypothetical protein